MKRCEMAGTGRRPGLEPVGTPARVGGRGLWGGGARQGLVQQETLTGPGGLIRGLTDRAGRAGKEAQGGQSCVIAFAYNMVLEDTRMDKLNNQGIWITADGVAELRPVPLAPVGPHDLLIETKACGVCAWDAKLYHGQSAPGDFP